MARVEKILALARPPTTNDDILNILNAMARVEKSLAIVLAEIAKMQTQPPYPSRSARNLGRAPENAPMAARSRVTVALPSRV